MRVTPRQKGRPYRLLFTFPADPLAALLHQLGEGLVRCLSVERGAGALSGTGSGGIVLPWKGVAMQIFLGWTLDLLMLFAGTEAEDDKAYGVVDPSG